MHSSTKWNRQKGNPAETLQNGGRGRHLDLNTCHIRTVTSSPVLNANCSMLF